MNEELVQVVVGLLFVAATFLFSMRVRRLNDRSMAVQRRIDRVATDLRFGRRGDRINAGRVDDVLIEISSQGTPDPDENNVRQTQVRIAAGDPLPLPVRFCAEGPATWLGSLDVEIGEQRFDRVVNVHTTDDAVARALLDGPTRDAVAAAIAEGLRFDGGVWYAEGPGTDWDEERLTALVRAVARAQRVLVEGRRRVRDVPQALREVARTDRHAGVRARALELLVQRGIADRTTLLDRCRDVDVNVRWMAARALGPDGADTLAEQMRTGSRTVRVRAASALGESAQLRPDLAGEVEDCLISALPDPELVHLALLGLTRHGTGRAVEPLKQAAASAPTSELRGFASQVLDAVRSRLDPAASGGLSLAELESGALSVAEDRADGRLAVAARPRAVSDRS